MFPFNNSGDLSFQGVGNPEEDEDQSYQHDLILDNELLAAVNLYTSTTTASSSSTAATFVSTTTPTQLAPATATADKGKSHRGSGKARGRKPAGDTSGVGLNDRRKMEHRDIERQRRHQMSTLFSNLRSLLPFQYLKGKKSMSDHIEESVSYIKQLQRRIKELGETREQLTKGETSSTNPISDGEAAASSTGCNKLATPNCSVEVFVVSGGLQVQISGGQSLSRALNVLLEARLDVGSCISNHVNGTLLHNIHCLLQVTEMASSGDIDVQLLQRRLYQVVSSNNPS